MATSPNPNEGPSTQQNQEPTPAQLEAFTSKANAAREKMQAQTAKDLLKIKQNRGELGGDEAMEQLIGEHIRYVKEEEIEDAVRKEGGQ